MKTETHMKYSAMLFDRHFPTASLSQRNSFILGNVMPDIDLFSYLRGFKIRPFFGHNWENAKTYILSKSERLGNSGYYGLGVLLHYLCDAFTHTHNIGFSGNVRQHNIYEKRLHSFVLQSNSRDVDTGYKVGFSDFLLKLHDRYLLEPVSCMTDAHYISLVSTHTLKYYSVSHKAESRTAVSEVRLAERYISRP